MADTPALQGSAQGCDTPRWPQGSILMLGADSLYVAEECPAPGCATKFDRTQKADIMRIKSYKIARAIQAAASLLEEDGCRLAALELRGKFSYLPTEEQVREWEDRVFSEESMLDSIEHAHWASDQHAFDAWTSKYYPGDRIAATVVEYMGGERLRLVAGGIPVFLHMGDAARDLSEYVAGELIGLILLSRDDGYAYAADHPRYFGDIAAE